MSDKVCAVVVTYNRKQTLSKSLPKILEQTQILDEVVVVDNASSDGTGEFIQMTYPQIRMLSLSRNLGGAGGFYEGMKWAYEAGFDWVWIMDDDAMPTPTALEEMLKYKNDADVLFPILQDKNGRYYGARLWNNRPTGLDYVNIHKNTPIDIFTFVGPLISRHTISTIGLPNKELFIWFDDFEYSLRIKRAGLITLLVPSSRIDHDSGQQSKVKKYGITTRGSRPAWKTYYHARNYLYTITRSFPGVMNLFWYSAEQTKHLIADVLLESDRWKRVRYRIRGAADGLTGRLGRRVNPN